MKKPVKQKLDFKIESGVHICIFGQNGSGKSLLGMNLIHFSEIFPVVIYDIKHDNDFFLAIPDGYSCSVLTGIETFREYLRRSPEHRADYIIVRPLVDERADPSALDAYLIEQYTNIPQSVAYIDEATFFHSGTGQAKAGLLAMLTTGRSLGLSCIICSQRPFFISTFVKSECKIFACYKVTTPRDKKELSDFCAMPADDLEKYHFWFYDTRENSGKLHAPIFDVRKK